tara:strand:+ start:623 stop:1210 length:588 start_codon:yes stop_codon:yes gene_type:complete
MKTFSAAGALASLSLGLCLGLGTNTALAMDLQPFDASAEQAVKALGGTLVNEIQGAVKKEGPLGAIATCNTQALPLTAQISSQQQLNISRTALRVRNPANQADAWEEGVLQQFKARQAKGEALQGMIYSEVVEQDGQQIYRMMQAIPTQKACLTCHGRDIAPEVAKKLHALYPLDKATGFVEGELRGAFSVRKVM